MAAWCDYEKTVCTYAQQPASIEKKNFFMAAGLIMKKIIIYAQQLGTF